MKFLKIGDASKKLGISIQTLRKWIDEDKIPHRTTPGGHRMVDIESYLEGKTKINIISPNKKREKVFYCRVSSNKQKDDLERQIELARKIYPEHKIIKDIGSGINWKRRGLVSLLERVSRGEIEEIIVFHRDILARFGFELIETICKFQSTNIMVHGKTEKSEYQSSEKELSEDLMAIITVYACRQMGERRYRTHNISIEIDKNKTKQEAEENIKQVDIRC